MVRRRFTKPALSAPDLIAFLEGKGLAIPDHAYAEHCLNYIGYYRLKIYMRPFENQNKKFNSGVKFDRIVEIYDFDRRLRLMCLDAIERIEVALRSHVINIMGSHGGPHFFLNRSYFEGSTARRIIKKLGDNGDHLSIKSPTRNLLCTGQSPG